ncbi:MAG: RhuM family protein [Ignavibacteriaceae bacterium]
MRNFQITATDGKSYNTNFYNLDVIISVGYRVKSKRGTQFQIWANKVLKDYLVQGYVLNGKKLKDQTSRIKELEKTLDIFSKVTESYQLKQDEFAREEIVTGVVTVILAMGAGRKAAAINEHLSSI